MKFELLIENRSTIYQPSVLDGVEWITERIGVPSKLKFSVVKDGIIDFTEGNPVSFKVNGQNVFYGFVFSKKRDKEGIIEVMAYDQMRYLKNKDTYVYTNKRASDVIEMIASDFNLNTGTIEQTSFIIPSRVETDSTLFDIILKALDLELTNRKTMYVLYDDFGKLTLKSLSNMKTNVLIDEETGENFEYTSTIDEATYNVIKYAYTADERSGTKVVFSPQPLYENGKRVLSETQKQWGILQYFLKEDGVVMNNAQAQAKANALLSLYNTKTRKLKITKQFGDIRVRAGTMPVINLDLGDMTLKNFMLVEKATHTFNNDEHWMDLNLRGGEFVG